MTIQLLVVRRSAAAIRSSWAFRLGLSRMLVDTLCSVMGIVYPRMPRCISRHCDCSTLHASVVQPLGRDEQPPCTQRAPGWAPTRGCTSDVGGHDAHLS